MDKCGGKNCYVLWTNDMSGWNWPFRNAIVAILSLSKHWNAVHFEFVECNCDCVIDNVMQTNAKQMPIFSGNIFLAYELKRTVLVFIVSHLASIVRDLCVWQNERRTSKKLDIV